MSPSPPDPARWAELSARIDTLLDLDLAARAAHLDALRAAGQGAEAEELAALLNELAALDAEGFLDQPALGGGAAARGGQTLGAYTLEHALGEGGMGSVWQARRTDGRYEGRVAIKLLRTGLRSRGEAERFAREGQLLARLDHPHIARLIDAGVGPDGQPYLVLDHVEGLPIDQHCEQLGLDLPARLRLFLDVLSAVAHAHSRLILHRDLKPSNILVSAQGQVKLLDFGIGKLLADAETPGQATELTREAGSAFTPQYAAPEQLQGGEVTTATDVYALGVLLYTLLSGEHPTPAPTATTLDRLRAVVEHTPRRLSDTVQRQGGAAAARRARLLRGDLETVVAKALKKAPAERYATAAEFADDLRRWLRQEPVRARPDRAAYRLRKFVQRNRWAVLAGSLSGALLLVSAGLALRQAEEANRQRQQAEGLLEFMLGDLRERLDAVGRLDVLDAVGSKVLAYYASQPARRQRGEDLLRQAAVLQMLGDLAEDRGRLAEAERSRRAAADTTAMLLAMSPDDPDRIAAHSLSLDRLGWVAGLRGEMAMWVAAIQDSLALSERGLTIAPEHPGLLDSYTGGLSNMGVVLMEQHDLPAALARHEAASRKVIELAQRVPGQWIYAAHGAGWQARALAAHGKLREALASARRMLSLVQQTPQAESDQRVHYIEASAQIITAQYLLEMGDLSASRQAQTPGLDRLREVIAAERESVFNTWQLGVALVQDARLLRLQGRLADSALRLGEVDAMLARAQPEVDPQDVEWQRLLPAMLLAERLRLRPEDEASRAAARALLDRLPRDAPGQQRLFASHQRLAAELAVALARACERAGRPAEAGPAWDDSLRLAEDGARAGNPALVAVKLRALLAQGRRAEAEALRAALRASDWRHPDDGDLGIEPAVAPLQAASASP